MTAELPLPPLEMRMLVGPTDPAAFDNPRGDLLYPELGEAATGSVFDFGCGCGRVARMLVQQRPQPRRYVGIDLHRGMIEWCNENLAPHAPQFSFVHHDVWNFQFNPGVGKPTTIPFPVEDGAFSLVLAHSVFTHLTEEQAPHYLSEASRILAPDGLLRSTWFLLDKRQLPMMQPVHNALYLSYADPSAAVLFDREWVRATARRAGLTIVGATPPPIRGYQWVLLLARADAGREEVELPEDEAPVGEIELPDVPANADRIGLTR